MRAREPDRSGYAVRSGVRLYFETYGDGPQTVVLLPPWSIVHSRVWKLQVPHLARHHRVVVYDGRGNGRSDRPPGPSAYDDAELVADALAVLDAAGVDDAVVVGYSLGARVLLALAADHPDRTTGAVFVGAAVELHDPAEPGRTRFEEERESYEGWGRWNAHHWAQDQAGFAESSSARCSRSRTRPGRSRRRSASRWRPTPRRWWRRSRRSGGCWLAEARAAAARRALPGPGPARGRRPDRPPVRRRGPARGIGCPIEVVAGGGHGVQARHPVWFNSRLHRFVEEVAAGARP